MKLSKGTIRPGTVMQVLENGVIKASAPGLFSFNDDPEKLPPITPWFAGSNSNEFSKVREYDDVWIMNFADNPRQLYWFRKDRVENNTNIQINEFENVEILCNRDVKGDWVTIHFTDGSGWVIGKGDSIVQIRPDGSILMDTSVPNRAIDINVDNISIGSVGTSAHPAAYGDETEAALMALLAILGKVQMVALMNPYTMAIGTVLQTSLQQFSNKISNISSNNVTID